MYYIILYDLLCENRLFVLLMLSVCYIWVALRLCILSKLAKVKKSQPQPELPEFICTRIIYRVTAFPENGHKFFLICIRSTNNAQKL